MLGKQHFILFFGEKTKTNINKKQHFMQHIKMHTSNSERYMDSSKNKGKKVDFAAEIFRLLQS